MIDSEMDPEMSLNGNSDTLPEPAPKSYTEAEDEECAAFQALMPERVGAGEDLHVYPHMQTCERCRSLLGELEFIAEFARQLMPQEEEPRDELWDQIQNAIRLDEA